MITPSLVAASRLFLFVALAATASAQPIILEGGDFKEGLQPQLAVDSEGAVHLVFGKKDGGIFHTVSRDSGTFGAPVKIGVLPKLALGMHRGPRVVVTGDRLIVTAISHESGDLMAWTSVSGGESWQGPAKINSVPKAAVEGLHAMAAQGSKVAVGWLDHRGANMELWGALSEDGGATWKADTRFYQSPDGPICTCCAPSLAFDSAGGIAAMWRNNLGGARDLYLATSKDSGKTFSTAVKLGDGTWKINACPMDGGGLAFPATGGGEPFTIWRRESALYLARPGQRDEALGEGKNPVIAMEKGGPVLAWQAKAGLVFRRSGETLLTLDPEGHDASLAVPPKQDRAIVAWESGGRMKVEIIPSPAPADR